MLDDEDRPRDASNAAEHPWTHVVVPDDISELSADIEAYRRERRRLARQARLQRLSRQRGVLPLLITTVAILVAGLVATMLTVLGPSTLGREPTALPVATNPSGGVGEPHGLLPDVALRPQPDAAETALVHSRDLRPTVIALIPTHCDCARELNTLSGQAFAVDLPFAIVEPGATDATTASAVQAITRGRPSIYLDPSGALARQEAARGITVVLVNRDATIFDLKKSVTIDNANSLAPLLQTMVLPVANPD
jgi:hypothetical protein